MTAAQTGIGVATPEAKLDDVVESVTSNLVAVVPHVMRHLLHESRQSRSWTDMTYQQFNVLTLLAAERAMSQAKIARRLLVTPPVVARLSMTLVESGLLQRKLYASDRRLVLVAITPKGRRRVAAMRRDFERGAERLTRRLDDMQLRALQKALSQLRDLLIPESEQPERGYQA